MKIIVYHKPNCVQCEFTMKQLEQMGLVYEDIDVSLDRDARRDVEAMGYTQLPVVVASNRFRTERWSGFKIEKIRSLKTSTGDY